jgi:ribosomal protein L7/L12
MFHSSELIYTGDELMTISEYMLGFLLIANAIALLSNRTRQLPDVERKLNLVLAHFGIDPTAEVAPSDRVTSLASDPRQRIEAIKAYRMQTGAGLKESAAVIDRIAASAKGSGA